MKVFVTGATGFLGASLVPLLVKEGFTVTASGRDQAKGQKLKKSGARFVRLDLSDPEGVFEAIKDHEIVVHCAALSSPWGRYEDFYQANVANTEHVLNASIKSGVRRVVHISTPSVCFRYKHQMGILETDPLPDKKVNAYASTKFIAEGKVREAGLRGLETLILRPRGLFGPGDNAIMPRVIRAGSSGSLPVFSKGPLWTDLTYVDNVSYSILCAINAAYQSPGEVFNITNGEPVDLIPLFDKVFQKIGKKIKTKYIPYQLASTSALAMEFICRHFLNNKEPVMTRYLTGLFCFSQTLDISKARRLLNYQPAYSMDEGIDRFACWWNRTQSR